MFKEKQIIAKVGADGKLRITGELELAQFLQKNANKSLVLRFSVLSDETSARLTAYYYKYIVPRVRESLVDVGEILTERETDMYLRRLCPYTQRERFDKKIIVEILEISELGNDRMLNFLEWCKQFAAENLSTILDDPDESKRASYDVY